MKKSHFLIATLCASALVLSACTLGGTTKKKKKKSSSSQITSVEPGPSSGGQPTSGGSPTSGGGQTSVTPGSSGTPTPSSSEAPVKTLQSIAVTHAPTKTVYTAGESFDPTGMVVTATYSDGSTADVTSQCTFSPSTLAEGTTSVTVSFGGKSTTQAVTVNAPVPTAWSAAELEMLDYYLDDQSAEIPFMYVKGAELYRDSENVCLTYGYGEDSIDDAFLQSYVDLFDADWEIEFDVISYYFYDAWLYSGSKEFTVQTTSGSYTATISVTIYALGDDGYISEDGSGHFGVDFSNGCYFGWNEFEDEYQSVLDFLYDEYDEEAEEYKPFPNTVEFPGSATLIEVEDDLEDDGSGYYVAHLYGVSQADWNDYLDGFYDGSWKGYEDTLNGCQAFYDTEFEKIAIGYLYVPSQQYAILLIHQYEAIYRSWNEVKPVVNGFIDTINSETEMEVPAFGADSYIVEQHEDKGYVGVFAFGSDDAPITQASVDDYVASFSSEDWFTEPVAEEETAYVRDADGDVQFFGSAAEADAYAKEAGLENYEVKEYEYSGTTYYYIQYVEIFNYTFARSKDFALDMQIAYQASTSLSYAVIIVIPRAPVKSEFPGSDVVSFFEAKEIVVSGMPEYTSTSAAFNVESDESEFGVEILGSSEAELSAFIADLGNNGWAVDSEASDASKGITVLMYGSTLARATVYDYMDHAGARKAVIVFDVKVVTWSEEDIAFFEENLGGIIPPYTDAQIDYDYFAQTGQIWTYDTLTQDEFDAYVKAAEADGWVKDDSGTVTIWKKSGANGYAYFYYSSYIRWVYVRSDWTAAEKTAFSEALHGIVPPYLGTIYTGTSEHDFEGYNVYSEAQLATYDALLVEAGWTKTGEGKDAVYTKNSQDGAGYAQVAWEYYSSTSGSGYYWVIDWVDGTPVPPTPQGESVKYTFTNTHSGTKVEDVSTIYGWFSSPETSLISAVSAPTNVYAGANGGSGDSAWSVDNALKIGKASEGGSLTFTIAEGKSISKIVITGYGWKNSSSPALTITIGGAASLEDPLPYTTTISGGGEAGTVEFEFDTPLTGSFTIQTTGTAVIIQSIEIFYA